MSEQEARCYYKFRDGERILEFSDEYAPSGWTPYTRPVQETLRIIFDSIRCGDRLLNQGESQMKEIDVDGWHYAVKFDVFHIGHPDRHYYYNAPPDAIGYQLANHTRAVDPPHDA